MIDMKTNEVLNAFISMLGITENNYQFNYFHLPRIYCKDGFNISVQVNEGSYSGSENGYRTFGNEWLMVEWGFPSEAIDCCLYDAECYTDAETVNSVGSIEIEKIDELFETHGGIDILATLSNATEWFKREKPYILR